VPGADLDGVLYLRTLDDNARIKRAFVEGARVVIVGGGWIGLETASAARAAGATVTILEMAELPLLRVLGPTIATVFADLHRDHGVDLRTSVGVSSLKAGDGGREGSVGAVVLDDGSEIEADTVIVGVGITPNVGLAADSGLDIDDGIAVDEHLRTSDPDVFAAGDVANAYHPLLRRRLRVEHWANALNQPAVAADAMTGGDLVYDRQPYFFSDQYDLGMEYVGYVAPGDDDEVVVRGDLATREFIAFWLKDGRVLAGMNVNVWDVTDPIKELIASGLRVDTDRLADPDVPLGELVPSAP
jgi:3-phenylpropionate/trans-cinnamate dioxygenase ferredoxin reductase subunit